MAKTPRQRLMIDFATRRVWCFVCSDWVPAHSLLIDGTHDVNQKGGPVPSNHTVLGETNGEWE